MADQVPFVYDGDTIYEDGQGYRSAGVDTSEMRVDGGHTPQAGAVAAQQRWQQLMDENPDAERRIVGADPYGRKITEFVTKDGKSLNEQMVREGLAVPFMNQNADKYDFARLDAMRNLRETGDTPLEGGSLIMPQDGTPQTGVTQEFGEGLRRGAEQTGLLFATAAKTASQALGLTGVANHMGNLQAQYAKEVQKDAPEVGSYKDVDDWKSGLMYVSGMLGENIPQFGVDLAIGAATGGTGLLTAPMRRGIASAALRRAEGTVIAPIASKAFTRSATQALARDVFAKYANRGMFGSQYAQAVGDAQQELEQNGVTDGQFTALIAGLAPAGLDFMTTKALLRTASRAAKGGDFNRASEIIKEGVKQTGLQGANEALSELVNKAAVLYHVDGFDVFSGDNIEDMMNATLGGMLFGSVSSGSIGGAAFARSKLTKRASREEVAQQNADILGVDETQQEAVDSGEPVVNVSTQTDDGGYVEETARASNVDNVAKRQAKQAEDAGNVVASQNVRTPEDTIADRTYKDGSFGFNVDQVPQPKEEILAELKAVKNGSKNVVLLTEAQLAQLRTEPDAFSGMLVTTTNDGRAAVYKPQHRKRIETSLQASEPETFHGDGFFTTGLRNVKEDYVNQRDIDVSDEIPQEQPQEVAPKPVENVQETAPETEIPAARTQNLREDAGNRPQEITQTQPNNPVPFESGMQGALPFGDATERGGIVRNEQESVQETDKDGKPDPRQIPFDFGFDTDNQIAQIDAEYEQRRNAQSKKAYARREGAGDDTARPTGKRTKDARSEYSSDDYQDATEINGTGDGFNEREGQETDAVKEAVASSEAHQKARRDMYATQAAENNRAGEIRADMKTDIAHLADLQERVKAAQGSQKQLLQSAVEATQESISDAEKELAYINATQKARKGKPKKDEFENNPNTIKFAKDGDPRKGIREVFMPDVVAKVIESNDPLYQSVSGTGSRSRYTDVIADIVASMAEDGYSVGSMEGKPLAYDGKGGFYTSGNLLSRSALAGMQEEKRRKTLEVNGEEAPNDYEYDSAVEDREYLDKETDQNEDDLAREEGTLEDIRTTNDFAVGDRKDQASASVVTRGKKAKDKITFTAAKGKRVLHQTLQKIVRDMVKVAGIEHNVAVHVDKVKGKGIAEVQGIGTQEVTLVLDTDKMKKMFPDNSPDIFRLAVAHEIGHMFTRQELYDMPDSVVRSLYDEFEKAKAKVDAKHTYNKPNGVGFDEFIADQFGLYLNGKSDVDSSSRSWFRKVAQTLTKLVNSLADIFGRVRLTPNENMFKLFDGMIRGTKRPAKFYSDWMNQAFMTQSAGTRVRSYRNDIDMRQVFEQKAMHKNGYTVSRNADKDVQAEIDRIRSRGSAEPDGYNLTVGDAFSEMDGVSKMVYANLKDFLSDREKVKTKLNSMWDFTVKATAPVLSTADGELRRMGQVGAKVAKMYRDVFDSTSAMRGIWLSRLERVVKKVDPEDMKKFIEGAGELPQEIRTYLNALHNQIGDKEVNPSIGWLKDYFPRMYDMEQIETRRDEFENLILNEAHLNGIAMSKEGARTIVSGMLSGDNMFTNYADMKMSLHGPSFQNGKLRELDFVSDTALRVGGFLQKDVVASLERYTANAIRQNEYLKKFGGWNTIESETEFETRTGRTKNPSVDGFLYNMLMDFPLRNSQGRVMDSFEKEMAVVPSSDVDFQSKNAPYIKQLLDKGFVRKKGKDFEYFDRNKHLRRYGAMIQSGSQQNFERFSKIIDAYEGRLGADTLSPQTRKLMSNAMAYQNATTMLLSGFSAIPDMAGVFFRSRDFGGMLDATKEIYRLVAGTDRKERRALIADLGFMEGQLATQALLESYGLQHMSGGARRFNDALFKYNGTRALTNFGRVMTASMAERFIARNAKRAANGDKRAVRYLEELGLTPQEAAHINREGFKFYNHYVDNGLVGKRATPEAIVAEKIHKAMHAFVDSAMVRPNATQRPVWGSDPRWMLVWHLKSFMYSYGKVILGGLGNEMRARWRENNGNVKDKLLDASIPMMVYTAPVLLTSALALALRQKVQYDMWGDEAPTDNMDWNQYLFEIAKRGGVLGPAEMGYNFVDAATSNRSALAQILGPTASQLETILSFDPSRILGRSVPIASQIPAVRQWMLASMGVE